MSEIKLTVGTWFNNLEVIESERPVGKAELFNELNPPTTPITDPILEVTGLNYVFHPIGQEKIEDENFEGLRVVTVSHHTGPKRLLVPVEKIIIAR